MQSLSEVMRGLLKEITILDAGSADVSRTNYFTTSTFLIESEKRGSRSQKTPVTKPFSRQMHDKSCTYCKAFHSTSECTVVLSYDKRLEFVKSTICVLIVLVNIKLQGVDLDLTAKYVLSVITLVSATRTKHSPNNRIYRTILQ
jgi:hypothetical protein